MRYATTLFSAFLLLLVAGCDSGGEDEGVPLEERISLEGEWAVSDSESDRELRLTFIERQDTTEAQDGVGYDGRLRGDNLEGRIVFVIKHEGRGVEGDFFDLFTRQRLPGSYEATISEDADTITGIASGVVAEAIWMSEEIELTLTRQ